MRRYALVIMIGVLIILLALLMIPTGGTETAPSEPSVTEPEIIIEEHNGLRIKGVFRGEKAEPKNRERGERYEQETGEEEGIEVVADECSSCGDRPTEVPVEVLETCQTEAPEVYSSVPVPQEDTSAEAVVNGEVPADDEQNNISDGTGYNGNTGAVGNTTQPDLHEYLMSVLTEHNIQHWYPYACAQIQQESGWNPYAENKNGLDKGLLQYRITYYTGTNIFDPYEQIRIYVGQVANRLNAGLSVEETISRHMTSDWVTDINWQYVQDVLRWMN